MADLLDRRTYWTKTADEILEAIARYCNRVRSLGGTASTCINKDSHPRAIRALVVDMNDKDTWFITGAGRGMGVSFAKAALAAGHAVVATGRNPNAVGEAVGDADDLLVVTLDVTSPDDAHAAVRAAVDRFGRIDVLVNNAASFYAGDLEQQIAAYGELSSSLAHENATAGVS